MKPRQKALTVLLQCSVAVLFALPLFIMFIGSLKPPEQLASDLLPQRLYWQNYRDVLTDAAILQHTRNSAVLSFLAAAGTTATSAVVAFGFSVLQWRGRDQLFFILIATMLLPFHVTMLPRFELFSALGLYNTYWPILLPKWLGQEAFQIFLLRQFLLTIPRDLADAARIDNASEWAIFRQIYLPLLKPALVTVALLQFLETWNEYAAPLLYLNNPEKFPLAYALQQFVSAYRTQFGPLMAGTVLFTLPALLLFLLAQRQLLRGIATTGLKG